MRLDGPALVLRALSPNKQHPNLPCQLSKVLLQRKCHGAHYTGESILSERPVPDGAAWYSAHTDKHQARPHPSAERKLGYDSMRKPDEKSPGPPGGRAAERLRDFLEKRLPPEQVEAELEKQTNIEKKKRKKEPGPPEKKRKQG